MIDPGKPMRTPPETQPPYQSQSTLNSLTVPKLREYFLTHWDWYTLQTLTMQKSVSELEEIARPHVQAMTFVSHQCAKVLMHRFSYSAEKSLKQVENWLDTAYEIPDND